MEIVRNAINCKVEPSITWHENCILSSARTAATFTITDTKLYVPIITLKTKNNTKLSKLLNKGFKRSIPWNKYKIIFKTYDEYIRERLDTSFKGLMNYLFLLMQLVIILLMKIFIENIFFQELK